MIGECGSLVFCESYESARIRPGVQGDELMLGADVFEVDLTMPEDP